MSNEEHYFENLLFHGKDCNDNCNKNSLSPEVQRAIEICATYIIYTTFGNRENFLKFIKNEDRWDNAPTVKPCKNCDLYFKAMTKEEMKKGGAENDK